MTQKIILGSSSPRRQELLATLGVAFDVVSPNVEEQLFPSDPLKTVLTNSKAKYRAVAEHVRAADWVLTADTVVFFDNACYLKPMDVNEASNWFRRFSGRAQEVFTGFSFGMAGAEPVTEHEVSTVWFKTLTDQDITAYFRDVNPLDKAGGYDINELGDRIIDRWEGSRDNIMGLPTDRIRHHLLREGLL